MQSRQDTTTLAKLGKNAHVDSERRGHDNGLDNDDTPVCICLFCSLHFAERLAYSVACSFLAFLEMVCSLYCTPICMYRIE